MQPLIQSYCKMACFVLIRKNKYNLCHCHPFCKLLNNTLNGKSGAYIQGPYIKYQSNDCDCIHICKHTLTAITVKK